jgi:peroxiredoxin
MKLLVTILLVSMLTLCTANVLQAQERPRVQPPHVEASDAERDVVATVWIFMNTTCPVSEAEAPYLKALRDTFQTKGIQFIAVFSGEHADTLEIEEFLLKHRLTVPVLYDKDMLAANSLGANVTPQVVIVLPDETVVYRGRVNDLFEQIGRRRSKITNHDARDVLRMIVKGAIPTYRTTDAVGCVIER